jgi:hypothetical protein
MLKLYFFHTQFVNSYMFQSILIIFRVLLNINKAYYTICSSAELTSSTLLQIVCIKYNFN